MPLSAGQLQGIMEGNRGATEAVDLAQQITDWYHQGVLAGFDLTYSNPALQVNKGAFYAALAPAYVDVESPALPLPLDPSRGSTGNVSVPIRSPNEGQISIIENAHRAAAIAYWTGAQLAKINPPPGTISIVENPVLNPGSLSLGLQKIDSVAGWAGKVTAAHTAHLKTISGVTTALVPTPTGPVPQDFPWTGYD